MMIKRTLNRLPWLRVPAGMIGTLRFLAWKRRVESDALAQLPALIDFDRTLQVAPSKLRVVPGTGISRQTREQGAVPAGNWDLEASPLEKSDLYKACEAHFLRQVPWDQSDWGRASTDKTSIESRRQQADELDALYATMGTQRSKSEQQRGAAKPIQISIGRNGELIIEEGIEFAVVARVLKLESIPAIVAARHPEWVKTIGAIADFASRQDGRIYNEILHPDLNHIPALHRMERFDLIRPYLPPPPGEVLDIGCNWGFFCILLEQMGFDCVGVEAERRNAHILKKMREAHACRFQVVQDSVFDYPAKQEFDLVLALYIFHHFLKLEDTYGQLIDLLGRLKMKRMVFGCHNKDQKAMQNAYRNYAPEDFVEFIIQHSCLTTARHIGSEDGRREIYLIEA